MISTKWRIAADDGDTAYLQNVCFLTQLCLSLFGRGLSAFIHRKSLTLQPCKVYQSFFLPTNAQLNSLKNQF
jgi:hypothetical protein